jgi:hypothetical protein
MPDTAFTLPLIVSTTIPIVLGILPLIIVSLILLHPTLRSRLASKHRLPTDPSFRPTMTANKKTTTRNNRSTDPRPSKSSLNLRPLLLSARAMTSDRNKMVRREDFGISPRPSEEHDARLRGLFRGSSEPRIAGQGEIHSAAKGGEKRVDGKSGWIKSALGFVVAGGMSIISGILYLSLAGSTSVKTLNIALAVSITSLPFVSIIYTIQYTTTFASTYSATTLFLLAGICTIGTSALSAYVSIYIAVALSGAALMGLTLVVIAKTNILDKVRGRRRIQLPLDEKKGRREEEAEEMDRRETSWLTENSKLLIGPSGSY